MARVDKELTDLTNRAAAELKAHRDTVRWWAQEVDSEDWLRIDDCMLINKQPWAHFLLSGQWLRVKNLSCWREV